MGKKPPDAYSLLVNATETEKKLSRFSESLFLTRTILMVFYWGS